MTTTFHPWLLAGALALHLTAAAHAAEAGIIHVDCAASAGAPADGSAVAPVRTLDELNRIQFAPGTQILFKRGSVCQGSFIPRAGSSGRPGAPIVVGAYGDKRLPRPVIAAGCRDTRVDRDQGLTEAAKTPTGISPYYSLCKTDNRAAVRAAIHLNNVEHWEINTLELSNDGLAAGPRVGLLVQLEDFGTGSHYIVNDVYIHHVHGYQQDVAGSEVVAKETGGILFAVTRNKEQPGNKQKKTRFDDVLIENSEIYNVDGIGVSNRSAWGCRRFGANCADYPPYKGRPDYLKDPATDAAGDYYPSTRLVVRNNKIHNVGGDGIIVRTANAPLVESNLIYDIWMRAAGDSAGAWAINTNDALFQYNEVHSVRKREHMGDGMAFDADLGTWNTRIRANYSHHNEGGLMLFCACGPDGLGASAKTVNAVVENNLSLDDRHRIIVINGAEQGLVQDNLIISRHAGLDAPLVESNLYPTPNDITVRGNVLVNTAGEGKLIRRTHRPGSLVLIRLGGNQFAGYTAEPGLASTGEPDIYTSGASQDVGALLERWFTGSGFRQHSYRPGLPEEPGH